MVTVEVELKEEDEEPEQHLDEGEFIERRVVPLNELYSTLKGEWSWEVDMLGLWRLMVVSIQV